jgi:divalent metal cation (Fe/Co/Zn/Cd) transporter
VKRNAHILIPGPIQKCRDQLYDHRAVSAARWNHVVYWFVATSKAERFTPSFFGAIRRSKDPAKFMVPYEDSDSLIGLIIALAGTYFCVRLKLFILDCFVSILIDFVLAATAALIARETKGRLNWDGAHEIIVTSMKQIARSMDGVMNATGITTVRLAPQRIVVAPDSEFEDDLETPDIEIRVIELEKRLRQLHRKSLCS